MKSFIKKILGALLPRSFYNRLFSAYHLTLAYLGAIVHRFPSRSLTVIAVTGTKGKSSTAELIYAMLMRAGHKTALAGTIRFCIDTECEPNKYKMTMVGRFFLQRFLRKAVNAGCTHAVVEMTSEGALQSRHRGVDLDALVFTNLAPEHLERHGGMENYVAAKLSLAEHLSRSPKRPRIIVANADDAYGAKFLAVNADIRRPFSLGDAQPHSATEHGIDFTWHGSTFHSPLMGEFNLKNILAALTVCDALGAPLEALVKAVAEVGTIAGRGERIERGQDFSVVVDYAHTPDSLRALYETFANTTGKRICVLGSTGGGRDAWKRPAMGKIADTHCDIAILTDEDPYDEDPRAIIDAVAAGFSRIEPQVILDRRIAIRTALSLARAGDAVLITGKGTDPYIMRAHGAREPWSDRTVAEEELADLTAAQQPAREAALITADRS
ncbi:MAG TPA: UDP-N-acetylmuramoyl-L-alanyl-D-glutamate--2,6-diaminopimelate ligase [Candidatus Paceibacterota bacterium]